MRRADQINDRARSKRSHRTALKRAKRVNVAREHADGRRFRMRLADNRWRKRFLTSEHPTTSNEMLAAAGYARIFEEPRW